ncbi:MAG TPA: nucleoside triphosphate pyrophosphatase [Solirubrobacterales bacterium]|nr:nucleoside triphosphate pyrophosphatase [Solirubrobacterales bacterium]
MVRGVARLVLASASPRRREILAALGVEFETVVPDVEELTDGDPPLIIVENALRKARAGAEIADAGDGDLVLGVDTDVVLDGRVLGKPRNEGEARERLETLSARTHEVLSGVALVRAEKPGGSPSDSTRKERTALASSRVTFRALSAIDIDRYIASGEWRDRAGGYAIQGLGSTLVESLHGDFSNVVGLPLRTLLELEPALLA